MSDIGRRIDLLGVGATHVVEIVGKGGRSQSYKTEFRNGDDAKARAQHYFVKFFTEPKRPSAGASLASRKMRDMRCDAFERHRSRVYTAANRIPQSGQVQRNLGLQREGNTYFTAFPFIPMLEQKKSHASLRDALNAIHLVNKIDVIADAIVGVAALHNQGLVHGDIKLDNLAIYASGETRIRGRVIDYCDAYFPADFADRAIAESWISLGEFAMDTAYAAPEVLVFSSARQTARDLRTAPSMNSAIVAARQLSPASDVFALAVVVIEIITGAALADPGSRAARGLPVAFDKTAFGAMPALLAAVELALSASPAKRPTIEEFKLAFERRDDLETLYGGVDRARWRTYFRHRTGEKEYKQAGPPPRLQLPHQGSVPPDPAPPVEPSAPTRRRKERSSALISIEKTLADASKDAAPRLIISSKGK